MTSTHSKLTQSINPFVLAHFSQQGNLKFNKNGSIRIATPLSDQVTFFNGGNKLSSGSHRNPERLFTTLSSDNSSDDVKIDDIEHIVLDFTSKSGEAIKYHVDIDRDPVVKNGKLVVHGHREREDSYQDKLARSTNSHKYGNIVGSHKAREMSLYISSFDKHEAKDFHNEQLKGSDLDGVTEGRLDRTSLVSTNESTDTDRSAWSQTFKLIDYNYPIGSGSSASALFSLTPEATGTWKAPDTSWYDFYKVLDPLLYTADVNLGLTWNASASIKGADVKSRIQADKNFKLPSVSFPAGGILGGEVHPGAAVSAWIDTGANFDAIIGAKQKFTYNMKISKDGISPSFDVGSIEWTKPSFDPITGISVGGSITPEITLGAYFGFTIPVLGAVKFATANITLKFPFTFSYDTNSGFGSKISGTLQADATVLPFVDNGWSYPLGNANIFGPIEVT